LGGVTGVGIFALGETGAAEDLVAPLPEGRVGNLMRAGDVTLAVGAEGFAISPNPPRLGRVGTSLGVIVRVGASLFTSSASLPPLSANGLVTSSSATIRT